MQTQDNKIKLNPIEVFASYYCQDDMVLKVPEFHREMYQLAYQGHTRIVLCAPRSFAKSTVFSKIYPLYKILNSHCKQILLISATGELSEEMLSWTREQLEGNKYIIADYGGKPGKKWSNDYIEYIRADGSRVKVMAKGAGKQIRGFRPDIVICDDLDTDEGVLSPERRAKLLDWFNSAVINTMERDGQLIMVGTSLHPLSLIESVITRESYKTRRYQAFTPDNKSIWPEKWPVAALNARRAEIGHMAFLKEYMNQPIISENPIFVKEWFNEYESDSKSFQELTEKGLYTVMAIDPAISRKEQADYTAIVTVSATYEKDPKMYIRVGGTVRGRWPLNKQVSELDRLSRKFNVKKTIVETTAYQQALSDEYKIFCEENRRFPLIKEIKPDRDKERRAHVVVPLFERGRIYFDLRDNMTQRLMEELSLFPTGQHDDFVDALVYCLSEIKKWIKRRDMREETGKPYIVLPGKRRNEYTGIV